MSDWRRGSIGELTSAHRGVSYAGGQLRQFKSPETVTLLRSNNIRSGRLNFEEVQIVSHRLVSEEQLMRTGDIAVCMSNGSKALVGKAAPFVGSEVEDFTVGAFCSIFRPIDVSTAAFVSFIFQSKEYRKNLDLALAGTAINNLRNTDLEAFGCDIPPPDEQPKIAQVLDTLDTAIHETEAIIAKLKGVKQGLLHDLLTRGIDANGELRPPQSAAPHLYKQSPLGWIPNEWEVRPLSSCIASLDAGVSVNSEDRPHGASEIGVLKTSALSQGVFHPDQNKTVVAKEVRLAREPVEGDSILVSRMNTPQLVGASCYVAEPWPTLFLPDRIWQLKKTAPDSVHMRWLSYVFLTSNFRAYVEVHATGTSGSMKNLPKSRLREMPVAFPNLDEQMLIAGCLAKADDVVTSEAMQLEKLTAEKSGLMDDLLTGRIRVTPLLEAAP